jgi:hypothetical protein
MKKHRYTLILTALLVIIAAMLLVNRSNGTMREKDNTFAVSDTASITKIFLADKRNNTVKLEKIEGGAWKLNNSFIANKESVTVMLKTLVSVDIKAPVAKAARNNIIKLLAAKSVKVEVYQRVHRINLFGKIKLFPHEKMTKVYYVGDPTQDNIGTYMLMEGKEQPYVVYMPGFRGYVSTRYSAKEVDWRDHGLFDLKLPNIKRVGIVYTDAPQYSFMITNDDNRRFTLQASSPIKQFDTLKVINYLGSFRRINYEALLSDFSKHKYDSITSQPTAFVLTIEDKMGKVQVLEAWKRKAAAGELDIEGNPTEWDRDRMFARMKGSDDLVLIQYFVFDHILKPLNWFTDMEEGMQGL